MYEHETYSFGERFYNLSDIEKAHAYGLEIADRLILGSSTVRPRDAAAFLTRHEVSADNPYLTELRTQLADDLDVLHPEAVPSTRRAAQIAMGIREIVLVTNACAVLFVAQDVVNAESIRLVGDPNLLHQD